MSINEGGNGGDGWAVDFFTVGVTTVPASVVLEPSTLALLGIGAVCSLGYGWRRRRQSA